METGFSDLEIKEFLNDGLSMEEIELLGDAFAEAATIEMLPDNITEFVKKVDSKLPDDAKQAFEELLKMAESDPETFKQFMALQFVMSQEAKNEPEKPRVETNITRLSDAEYERVSKNYFTTLAHLSESERKEFLKLIENITDEQKQDLVNRLKQQ